MKVSAERPLPDLDRMRMMATWDGQPGTFMLPEAPYSREELKAVLYRHQQAVRGWAGVRHRELVEAARMVVQTHQGNTGLEPSCSAFERAVDELRGLLERE